MHRRTNRLTAVGTVALAAVLLLAACGSKSGSAGSGAGSGATPSPATTAELYEQAKKEGEVVWYSADVPAAGQAVNAAFEKAYPGIKVTYVRAASADLLARYTSEKKSGAPTADVIEQTDIGFSNSAQKDGFTQPFANAGIPGYGDIPKDWRMDSGDPYALTVWILAYNTKQVSADEAPKTLEDILDPKWKGKLVAPDPAQSGGYAVGWGTAADHFGNNYLQRLHDQNVSWEATGSSASEAKLVSGEKPVNLVGSLSTLQADKGKGAPIAWNVPPVSTGSAYIYSINSKPNHPAAARLFASFLISKAGNEAEFSQNPASGSAWLKPQGTQILTLQTKYADLDEATKIDKALTGHGPA